MTIHVSARVAWHDDGWNGRVCRAPAANTFCVGAHSYPGTVIAERRDVAWEQQCAGASCGSLESVLPCCFSVNTFGSEPVRARSEPPGWWNDGDPLEWELPSRWWCRYGRRTNVWCVKCDLDNAIKDPFSGCDRFTVR